MTHSSHRAVTALPIVAAALAVGATLPMPVAQAAPSDNNRLHASVVDNVYTVQQHSGCTQKAETNIRLNASLRQAAEWHAYDVGANRELDGDIGSDGSNPQGRGNAAGYRGKVSETVAINNSLAISGVDIMNQWLYDPQARAIMADCKNIDIGVWSSQAAIDRTVVVAVYGQPGG